MRRSAMYRVMKVVSDISVWLDTIRLKSGWDCKYIKDYDKHLWGSGRQFIVTKGRGICLTLSIDAEGNVTTKTGNRAKPVKGAALWMQRVRTLAAKTVVRDMKRINNERKHLVQYNHLTLL